MYKQQAELESFKMEYANARLECNAADERANILASEVIGLEEKVTKFQWFVSLVHPSVSVDCSILHDCYESFAMYCLGRYLVACLGNQLQTSMQTSIQAEPDKQQHFVYFVHL
ncbi:uncharacterized protein [Gossypium hirsutum]|uniref:Uncharacterized protein isoform X3 n=1 Tax=Gossypium hirsutum TaxID=3635 RepID=A0ABM3B075_GOSHI|nr:uncharacterized protein LOC107911489 isoform X3 [Gossypium hirsutum]